MIYFPQSGRNSTVPANFLSVFGRIAWMVRRSNNPSASELEAAAGRSVADVTRPDLDVLFCGINPGLWTAAVGHHFARPGNRFWKALHLSGFTERQLHPAEESELLRAGLGITNIVGRATRSAAELGRAELRQGAAELTGKLSRLQPMVIAFLGMSAYRSAFDLPGARMGLQPESIGSTRVWLLPNPSGAQARYQMSDIVAELMRLREFVAALRSAGPSPASRTPRRRR
jgi:TDG/mug DNA glycosylase family protein